jgi:hypothetical protein
MSDPITLFNELVNHYKTSIEDYERACALYREGKAQRPKWFDREGAERSIRIMQSGIFHKGGLKGKKLTVSGPPNYLVYPIFHLKILIDFLSGDFGQFEFYDGREKEFLKIEKDFDYLIREFDRKFDRISPYLKEYKITKGSEIKLRNQLVAWKEKLLKKKNDKGPRIVLGKAYYPPKHSIEIYITYRLASFVPDAPALTITNRANDLLEYLGKKRGNSRTLRSIVADHKRYLNLQRMKESIQKADSTNNR